MNRRIIARRVATLLAIITIIFLSGCSRSNDSTPLSSESLNQESFSDHTSIDNTQELSKSILFDKNYMSEQKKAYHEKQIFIKTSDGNEVPVNSYVPSHIVLDEINEQACLINSLATIADCGFDGLAFTNSTTLNSDIISVFILRSVWEKSMNNAVFNEAQNEEMKGFPASKNYFGPSDVGYLEVDDVNAFVSDNFSDNMQKGLIEKLSFYYCEEKDVYSVPWHIIEVQLLPVVLSYMETTYECEIVFSSVGFISFDERVLYYPGIRDMLEIGIFQFNENDNGSYDVVPGIYSNMLDQMNFLKVKLIKNGDKMVIDNLSLY